MRGDEGQFLSDHLCAGLQLAMRRLLAGVCAIAFMSIVAVPAWAQGSGTLPGPTGGTAPNAGTSTPDNQIPAPEASPDEATGLEGAAPAPEAEAVPADPSVQPQADPEQFTDDAARDAVNAGQAVGLGSLLPDITQRTSGTVIDAGMQSRNGTLIYSIRVLRPDGRVTTELYDATTGSYVGSSP